MPGRDHDGSRILDFGCGPGHDLVDFLEFSKPQTLVGADVSPTAMAIARQRVLLHPGGSSVEFIDCGDLSLFKARLGERTQFDYIHCSGVLHHVVSAINVLNTLKSLLAPSGRIRLMVYNRDSIWRNFYVPYVLQHRRRAIDPRLNLDDAFRKSTDGPSCPISNSYDEETIRALAESVGFHCEVIGTAISTHEINIWQSYGPVALADPKASPAVSCFIRSLKTDATGTLSIKAGSLAGINLVVELTHP